VIEEVQEDDGLIFEECNGLTSSALADDDEDDDDDDVIIIILKSWNPFCLGTLNRINEILGYVTLLIPQHKNLFPWDPN
jgi:hypothetical protein